MTIEEAIKELREASDNEVRYGDTEHHYNEVMKRIEAFDLAIKALEQCEVWNGSHGQIVAPKGTFERIYNDCKDEQQPSDDCISREAVIRLVEQYPNIIGNRCSGLIADIKHLPSVTSKPKIGHWIDASEGLIPYACSKCGTVEFKISKYCPKCGTKMEEP